MKKFVFLLIILITLSGCSVQKTMNAKIFMDRLSEVNDFLIIENPEILTDESASFCFVTSKNGTDFLFEFLENDNGNIKKISFSCIKTEKAEDFVLYVRDIISVYSPNENTDEIIMNLTENGKIKQGINYFENQWYLYCANADENGLFFSVTNKELFPQSSVEFSLKPNDRIEF